MPLVAILLAWGVSQVGRDAMGESAYVWASVGLSVGALALGAVAVLRALRA